MTRNGKVSWCALVPLLMAFVIACMGATSYMLDTQERTIHNTIKIIQVDLREVRNDVKDLLKKG